MNGDISSINSRTCCCTWHSHCGAAKSGPQVYNMIPYDSLVRCFMSAYVIVNVCVASQPLSSLPLSPSWSWSSFWFTTKHQRGSKFFVSPFFIVWLKSPWNKNETIRHSHQLEWNLHVKLQLRSHLTPRCAVEGVGGEAWMPCQKNVTKRLDGLMRKNS